MVFNDSINLHTYIFALRHLFMVEFNQLFFHSDESHCCMYQITINHNYNYLHIIYRLN